MSLDKGNWKLIVNKQLMSARGTRPQWVINRDDSTTNNPATEVGRAALTIGKPASPVETLEIALTRVGAAHGKMEIAWENVTASVPFTVN